MLFVENGKRLYSNFLPVNGSFIEFDKYPCPFGDCNHTKEGECEVKKAVDENNIMKSRYENYLSFIGE